MTTHRELYPKQYTHRLVGQNVKVSTKGVLRVEGIVERVVSSRFGPLAIIAGDQKMRAWSLKDCIPKPAGG